ncbi:acyl-CoA synthetase [Kribbella sp. NBC_00662]|uniref:acyl-CoA synthetase n=1 Tax=Kribbella sp. NBC_00662 TaxID=2975969 RepID=UPI0032443464
MNTDLLWPRYTGPADLPAIEAISLSDRGLPASTYAVLCRAAEKWPERTALSIMPDARRWRDHVDLTYGELRAAVHRAANLLYGLGVRRTDAVGLLTPNCLDAIVATLAAQTAGIATPVQPTLAAPTAQALLAQAGVRVLVAAGPEFDDEVWATTVAVARSGLVDAVVVLRPTGAQGAGPALPVIAGVRVGYLTDLTSNEPGDRFTGPPPSASDLAAVFHTGGTTGQPKLAAHTHSNEVSDAWMIAADSTLGEESVLFAALPLFHVNALVVTLLAPLLRGQRVIWAGPLGYRDVELYGGFWHLVEHFRIATMSGVPTVYQLLAQCPVDADISSLRFAMVGAAALPPAVRTAFEGATGVPLIEGYGLTEATCASVRGFADQPRSGAVGVRLPYQRVKVTSSGGLLIAGPTVFAGYVVGRDGRGLLLDGLGALADGWLDTGDLARIDDDGFVYLTGRAKDLIIRGGHNIDPGIIEEALLSHPGVAAAAAVGRPDRRAGELPVAYVVLNDGVSVPEEVLESWAAAHIAERAAAPKAVHLIEAIPMTAVGKPYKLALRADAVRRAAQDELGPDATVDAEITDGTVQVVVTPASEAGAARARKALDALALSWRLTGHPGTPS